MPRHLITDQRGGAAIEMGMLFPFMLLMTTGVVDLGMQFLHATAVTAAAQAGAAYLTMHPADAVTGGSGALAAMNAATGLTIQATPAPALVNGVLTVSARADYSPILSWAASPATLSSTLTIRLE